MLDVCQRCKHESYNHFVKEWEVIPFMAILTMHSIYLASNTRLPVAVESVCVTVLLSNSYQETSAGAKITAGKGRGVVDERRAEEIKGGDGREREDRWETKIGRASCRERV